MTRSIANAVEELKSSVRHSLSPEIIVKACLEVGHRWRDRQLNPVTTIWMFTLQIIHHNTACQHAVRLLPGISVTDGAYCQARARIPLAAFQSLFRRMTQRLVRSIDGALDRWHGHRVFFIDGSSCLMPDTPELQATFGQPTGQKAGCGFPMANLAGLFHRSGLLIEMLRCKTEEGVRKELIIYGVAYNLVRAIMVQGGVNQGVPPERISLIDVLRCLTLGLCRQELPRFVVNPHRPGRIQPRAVKRRQKQYARLTHPRPRMRKVMRTWTL